MPARSQPLVRGAALLLWSAAAFAGVTVEISVTDLANHPVAGARLELKAGGAVVSAAETDAAGHASFPGVKPGHYELAAEKQGFEAAQQADVDVSETGPASIEFRMVPALARQESIEVPETVSPVEQGASPPAGMTAQDGQRASRPSGDGKRCAAADSGRGPVARRRAVKSRAPASTAAR